LELSQAAERVIKATRVQAPIPTEALQGLIGNRRGDDRVSVDRRFPVQQRAKLRLLLAAIAENRTFRVAGQLHACGVPFQFGNQNVFHAVGGPQFAPQVGGQLLCPQMERVSQQLAATVTIAPSDASGNPLGQADVEPTRMEAGAAGPMSGGGFGSMSLLAPSTDRLSGDAIAAGGGTTTSGPAPVPEPSAAVLFALGSVILAHLRRRRSRAQTA
jgi:hypothetical protein